MALKKKSWTQGKKENLLFVRKKEISSSAVARLSAERGGVRPTTAETTDTAHSKRIHQNASAEKRRPRLKKQDCNGHGLQISPPKAERRPPICEVMILFFCVSRLIRNSSKEVLARPWLPIRHRERAIVGFRGVSKRHGLGAIGDNLQVTVKTYYRPVIVLHSLLPSLRSWA